MQVTDDIARVLGLKIHNEGHWDEEYVAVPGAGTVAYTSFNDAGVECEVGEFLYAMVRVLKPYHILETGTHWGMSTMYMASACRDNGHGIVETLEFSTPNYLKADDHFRQSGLKPYIINHPADVTKWQPKNGRQYQLALLDTEPQLRFAEFVRFFDYVVQGGFIFIHDLHRHMGQVDNSEHGYAWPWGKIPPFMIEMYEKQQIRPFHLPTPRGLTGFYKVAEGDHKWQRIVEP
jgi:predicted O-methyltransferase YrrM